MNYCALDDAFPSTGGEPLPGCTTDYATKMARKEERRKARRCKGPAASYLDIEDKDPDRQHVNKLPDVPAMNPSIGMKEHAPVTQEPFEHRIRRDTLPDQRVTNFDKDPLHDYMQSEMTNHMIPVKPPTTETLNNFFGADPDDHYADYHPDSEPAPTDFRKAFEDAGVAKAGSSLLATPSVNMYWKPLATGGAQTSFVEHLPPSSGKYYHAPSKVDISMEDVMRKMDKLFARLDDMNASSPEQVTSELLMFISSGIFVLFMMDLLVKKGSTMRF